MIAPRLPEVEAELAGLDRRLQGIARRYVRRLALQPYLGYPLQRGDLARERCRAIRFEGDDDPGDLFGSQRRATRAGNEDPSCGRPWRIVYWIRETPDRERGLVVALAVGVAHPKRSVFELAERTLKTIGKEKQWASW